MSSELYERLNMSEVSSNVFNYLQISSNVFKCLHCFFFLTSDLDDLLAEEIHICLCQQQDDMLTDNKHPEKVKVVRG